MSSFSRYAARPLPHIQKTGTRAQKKPNRGDMKTTPIIAALTCQGKAEQAERHSGPFVQDDKTDAGKTQRFKFTAIDCSSYQ
jgi:hypothetical protein